ncbi:MAG: PP2C family protein-serine/threonine phosphatase [Planctomycetota bacterium]
MSAFDCFAVSEQGCELDGNDDCVLLDAEHGVFVVADGLSGRPGGDRASRIAANTFMDQVRGMTSSQRTDEVPLRSAVGAANAAILAAAEAEPFLEGMGTTLSAAVLTEDGGRGVHIGDSRLYRFADGHLKRLTRDHTLVTELVELDRLREETARDFPLRNVLSRTLGTKEDVRADIAELSLGPGEWILLATDGLSDTMDDEQIEQIVAGAVGMGAEALCHLIVDAALAAEPRDNVTVAAVRRREGTADE